MDFGALGEIFNTGGTAAIFIAASWYMMKKRDEQDEKRDAEAVAREARISAALDLSHSYIQSTMADRLTQNSDAMNNVANALASLPCRSGGMAACAGSNNGEEG